MLGTLHMPTTQSSRVSFIHPILRSHVRTLATELNSPMPVIDLAHQHMLTARALHIKQKSEGTQKFDVLSWSALVAGSRVAAGLNGLNSAEVGFMILYLVIRSFIGSHI